MDPFDETLPYQKPYIPAKIENYENNHVVADKSFYTHFPDITSQSCGLDPDVRPAPGKIELSELSKSLQSKILQLPGISDLTTVQKYVFPIINQKRDSLICSQTGTGKTLAYAIPLIDYFDKHPDEGINAIVITPSRELALQQQHEINRIGFFQDHLIHFYFENIKFKKICTFHQEFVRPFTEEPRKNTKSMLFRIQKLE